MKDVPASDEHRLNTLRAMRVVIADPPAFTPAYDHELAAALARAGADVDLVTSRFRFGAVAEPDGYRRREIFYPLSSRALPALTPATARESARAPARSRAAGSAPRRRRPPAVARRAGARSLAAPPSLAARLDGTRPAAAPDGPQGRAVAAHVRTLRAHRRPLRAGAADARRVRRSGREASRHPPPRLSERPGAARRRAHRARAGDGAPLQADRALGRGCPSSRSAPARRRRLGRAAARSRRRGAAARLSLARRSSNVRSATRPSPSSPTAPELDQSGALLQALGAGVPAVVYDVGGLGEPVANYGAGPRRPGR